MGKILKLREITDNKEKKDITENILVNLPEYKNQPDLAEVYIAKSNQMAFFSIEWDNDSVGFISLKIVNKNNAEIFCIGVKEKFRLNGLGKKLISKAESVLKLNGFKILSVKTEDGESIDENLLIKKKFYEKCGFFDFEKLEGTWDSKYSCLILIKILN